MEGAVLAAFLHAIILASINVLVSCVMLCPCFVLNVKLAWPLSVVCVFSLEFTGVFLGCGSKFSAVILSAAKSYSCLCLSSLGTLTVHFANTTTALGLLSSIETLLFAVRPY